MKKVTIMLAVLILLACSGVTHAVEMVLIPGGEFEMGDHHGDGYSDELPIHTVLLDAFFMSKYETTNSQYCDYLNSAYTAGQIKVDGNIVYAADDTGNTEPYCDTHSADGDSQIDYSGGIFSIISKGGRDMSNDPMVEVSWYGAVAYCDYYGYRLPTEAEWEYAARGGLSGKRFPWSDPNITHNQANYYADQSYPYDLSYPDGRHPLWTSVYPYTSPVGFFDGTMKYKGDYNWPGSDTSYQTTSGANGYGLYDMAGNAYEWCNDWYDSSYYNVSPYDNPQGPVSGSLRILRSGGWDDNASNCRVANRYDFHPDERDSHGGFRVARDAEPACKGNGWIAFESNLDGDLDIWAVRADGTELRQLINQPGVQQSLQWSPDSTKIAYSSDYDAQIWVYDWSSGNSTIIYDADDYEGAYGVYQPAWSPDGSKILFREDASYMNPHITMINADGTGRQVVPVQSGYVSHPSWSPTGTAFAYDRRNSGLSYTHDLWIYDFTSTGDIMTGINHRLTQGASSESTTKFQPDWAPNGDIVFAWGHNIAVINPGESGNWGDPANPDVIFLTDDASYPSKRYQSASWSPDLSQIAYLYESSGQASLWIMDAFPGGNRYPLTESSSNSKESPDWGNPPCEPDIILLDIDIKPGSCPNPLRVNFIGNGVYPVAIVGSEDFDVLDINVDTVTLAGVAPLRAKVSDVSTAGGVCELGPDGIADLVLKFERQAVLDALEDLYGDITEIQNREELFLTLLAETYDGEPVTGTDSLVVLNRGAIKRKKK